jgi:hypothetical protein
VAGQLHHRQVHEEQAVAHAAGPCEGAGDLRPRDPPVQPLQDDEEEREKEPDEQVGGMAETHRHRGADRKPGDDRRLPEFAGVVAVMVDEDARGKLKPVPVKSESGDGPAIGRATDLEDRRCRRQRQDSLEEMARSEEQQEPPLGRTTEKGALC